jgi:hypothetical protein
MQQVLFICTNSVFEFQVLLANSERHPRESRFIFSVAGVIDDLGLLFYLFLCLPASTKQSFFATVKLIFLFVTRTEDFTSREK